MLPTQKATAGFSSLKARGFWCTGGSGPRLQPQLSCGSVWQVHVIRILMVRCHAREATCKAVTRHQKPQLQSIVCNVSVKSWFIFCATKLKSSRVRVWRLLKSRNSEFNRSPSFAPRRPQARSKSSALTSEEALKELLQKPSPRGVYAFCAMLSLSLSLFLGPSRRGSRGPRASGPAPKRRRRGGSPRGGSPKTEGQRAWLQLLSGIHGHFIVQALGRVLGPDIRASRTFRLSRRLLRLLGHLPPKNFLSLATLVQCPPRHATRRWTSQRQRC